MVKTRRSSTSSSADQEETQVSDTVSDTDNATPEAQAPAAPAKPKKPDIPEGFVTPTGFTHELKTQRGVEVRPQVIYGYKRNNMHGFGDLFQTIGEAGNTRDVVSVERALAWWDEKEKRKQERATKASQPQSATPEAAAAEA